MSNFQYYKNAGETDRTFYINVPSCCISTLLDVEIIIHVIILNKHSFYWTQVSYIVLLSQAFYKSNKALEALRTVIFSADKGCSLVRSEAASHGLLLCSFLPSRWPHSAAVDSAHLAINRADKISSLSSPSLFCSLLPPSARFIPALRFN